MVTGGPLTRRNFLSMAAAAVAVAAGAGCEPGSNKPRATGAARGEAGGDRTLRIAQLSHFVPAFDRWFDDEYTRRWGEEHGVRVVVEHIPAVDLAGRGAAEAAAGRGHDLFGF